MLKDMGKGIWKVAIIALKEYIRLPPCKGKDFKRNIQEKRFCDLKVASSPFG